MRGIVSASVYEGDRLISSVVSQNTVMLLGRQQMVKLIVGETTQTVWSMGATTAIITPTQTDVALPSELTRQDLTVVELTSSYQQHYVGYFSPLAFGTAGSTQINGVGLFDSNSTGGYMWAEASLTVSKTTAQSLIVDWIITATT